MPNRADELKSSGLKATLPRIKILEIFQRAQRRHMTAEDVYKALLADGFLEFGASGRSWDKASMRQALAGAMPTPPVDLEDFAVEVLADDVALVTYRLGPPRPSNRSSVWVRRDGRWQVRFHQGTLAPE